MTFAARKNSCLTRIPGDDTVRTMRRSSTSGTATATPFANLARRGSSTPGSVFLVEIGDLRIASAETFLDELSPTPRTRSVWPAATLHAGRSRREAGDVLHRSRPLPFNPQRDELERDHGLRNESSPDRVPSREDTLREPSPPRTRRTGVAVRCALPFPRPRS